MLTVTIWLTIIKELTDNLQEFLKMLKSVKDSNPRQICCFLKVYYRQIQVFTILVNDCLQTYFWPVAEFYGTVISIGLAYVLIRYHTFFNIYVQGSVAAALLTTMIMLCVIFDVGSQPLPISSKIIRFSSYDLGKTNPSTYFRKIVKSYQPVVLKVGHFHNIDRKRGPSLMRYILQRTVFLLLKSEDS